MCLLTFFSAFQLPPGLTERDEPCLLDPTAAVGECPSIPYTSRSRWSGAKVIGRTTNVGKSTSPLGSLFPSQIFRAEVLPRVDSSPSFLLPCVKGASISSTLTLLPVLVS